MQASTARDIAFIAHTACGQFRADGVTPYIRHPERVAELTIAFSKCDLVNCVDHDAAAVILNDRVVAAYLHDVLEDTKLREEHLVELGITAEQLDIVKRLTKPDSGPSPASYYAAIAESANARVVKAADRSANLEDALSELLVEEPQTPRRWGRYVEKTYCDVLPMYDAYPLLKRELETRLAAIEEALPAALERRAAVARQQESRRVRSAHS